MRDEHAIGQEVAKSRPRPSVHNAVDDGMQVGAGADVVRDAGGDDRQDVTRALAAIVEPGKEPIFSAQDQAAQFALTATVGGLDVSIFEKQQQPSPLAVQIPERLSERCLGRHDGALPIDPSAELVGDRPGARLATLSRSWAVSSAVVESRSTANKRAMIRSPSSATASPERAASTSRLRP